MDSNVNSVCPRVAVAGLGYWGKNLIRTFHGLGALAALCDSADGIEEVYGKQYADAPFHRDFTSILADPSIDAIALSTPAVTHYELAKASLEAGKDVYVEKPLAIRVSEAEELVDLAVRTKRILMVGHILRYHPAIKALRSLIQTGVLGKINYVYSNRLNIGKIRTEENILWSFAPHDVSVLLALLNEMPERVTCRGGAWLSQNVFDVTLSQLEFPSGVQAHIFVSWLHPVKEQRLVVVGTERMAVFDDTAEHKLTLYPHKIEWRDRIPVAVKGDGEVIPVDRDEPLRAECDHFLRCVKERRTPITDGAEGLRVLRVLDACQRALQSGSAESPAPRKPERQLPYFAHKSAYVDKGAQVGAGSKIWHFSHVMQGARIGERCVIGQNVNVDGGTEIGNNVKIQNNVSVYNGTIVEDDVFLGPSCVLTNVSNPRSQINRHALYETTRLKRGCTIGANATVVCGVIVGRYSFVGAGSVVTKDVPDFALVVGSPARQVGWMSRHAHRLGSPDEKGIMRCPETGHRYREVTAGVLRCLDLDDDVPLSAEFSIGTRSYRDFKEEIQNGYSVARPASAVCGD
jgi:UDP-2-acetamido-3-amino-2,3-dideoxy-glucuronate N-acetyltransferase